MNFHNLLKVLQHLGLNLTLSVPFQSIGVDRQSVGFIRGVSCTVAEMAGRSWPGGQRSPGASARPARETKATGETAHAVI